MCMSRFVCVYVRAWVYVCVCVCVCVCVEYLYSIDAMLLPQRQLESRTQLSAID